MEINEELLKGVIQKLQGEQSFLVSVKGKQLEICTAMLKCLCDMEDSLREACPYNWGAVGRQFYDFLFSIKANTSEFNEKFFLYVVRFFREAHLFVLRKFRQDNGWRDIWYEWEINIYNHGQFIEDSTLHRQVKFIMDEMPIQIVNWHLGSPETRAFLKFEELNKQVNDRLNTFEKDAEKKIQAFQSSLSNTEEISKDLNETLKRQNATGTFIKLEKGFEDLLVQKKGERKRALYIVYLLAVLVVLPMAISFCVNISSDMTVEVVGNLHSSSGVIKDASVTAKNVVNGEWESLPWFRVLSIIGLEFVLLYFFRIALNHYLSLKTQIMQLEFRRSLCQFIDAYSDYAKRMQGDDKYSLERFENLVFSNIVPDSDKVPSTFDGLEHVANFFKSISGKTN